MTTSPFLRSAAASLVVAGALLFSSCSSDTSDTSGKTSPGAGGNVTTAIAFNPATRTIWGAQSADQSSPPRWKRAVFCVARSAGRPRRLDEAPSLLGSAPQFWNDKIRDRSHHEAVEVWDGECCEPMLRGV